MPTRLVFSILCACALLPSLSTPARSTDPLVLAAGTWTAGGYAIEGGWRIVDEDGKLFVVLDEAFRTRRAPDLKLFLSPLPLAEIGDRNATRDALLVAPLDSARGAQRYPLTDEVDLTDYKSLIIHCERYSKYWGGFRLAFARALWRPVPACA